MTQAWSLSLRVRDGPVMIQISISEDGLEFLVHIEETVRIPRTHFDDLGGRPRLLKGNMLPITAREKEILAQLARGRSNKEIAAALSICVRTVKFHVSNLLRKYEVSTRTELP
jgi:DNA-binding NarL/FixJ family response regulator